MTFGSVFSGIGCADYAAKSLGYDVLLQSEIDTFCNKVLAYHYPNAFNKGDITKADFSDFNNKIDVLCGGFPCQSFSTSGDKKGNSTLYYDYINAIRQVKPLWVIAENVRGIFTTNSGEVPASFESIMEAEGYKGRWYLLPACLFGAIHERYRALYIGWKKDYYSSFITNSISLDNKRAARFIRQSTIYMRRSRVESNQPAICVGDYGFAKGLSTYSVAKFRNEALTALGNGMYVPMFLEILDFIKMWHESYINNML